MIKFFPSILYVMATALAGVFIVHINTYISPFVTLFLSVSLSILFFNFINFFHLQWVYRQLLSNFGLFLWINFLCLILWVSVFLALKWADPFTVFYYYFCIASVFAAFSVETDRRTLIMKGAAIILMLMMTVYFLVIYMHNTDERYDFILSSFASLLGGISAFYYRRASQHYFEKTRGSASQVLAISFYGSFFMSAIALLVVPDTGFALAFSKHIFLLIVTATILSFIIPLYLNQKGLQFLGYNLHSCILSLTPFVALGAADLFKVIKPYNQHAHIVLIAVVAVIVIIVANLYGSVKPSPQ